MGQVSFTATLRRHVPCPPVATHGGTVREVLDDVFVRNPQLRSYLLDEHGRLRRHVNIYVGDHAINDRLGLSDPVAPEDEVYVFQALSGG